jgi:hypothetical protein
VTIEEAIKQSFTMRAFSKDGSTAVFRYRNQPNDAPIFWSPLIGDRRPRISDVRRLEPGPMDEFLRGMTWIPEDPKDSVTLLGEVAHDEGS